jgi:hypothetical protein
LQTRDEVAGLLVDRSDVVNSLEKKTDVTVFQVSEISGTVTLSDLTKILKLIGELIDSIAAVYCPPGTQLWPEVVLLDSGSPAIVGIKTSLELGEALFNIFKEVWGFLVSRKHHQNKIEMTTLIDNLVVMKKISESEKEGTISPEKARHYKAMILIKTEDLIGLKVLPKQLADEALVDRNVDLLQDIGSVRLFTAGSEFSPNPEPLDKPKSRKFDLEDPV